MYYRFSPHAALITALHHTTAHSTTAVSFTALTAAGEKKTRPARFWPGGLFLLSLHLAPLTGYPLDSHDVADLPDLLEDVL